MPVKEEQSQLPTSVLFCSRQNSVLSPMAEAIMKEYFGYEVYVQSAGVLDELEVDSLSVTACAEIGVNLERHKSKSFKKLEENGDDLSSFDLVVALDPAAQRQALEYTRFYNLEVEYWPVLNPVGLGKDRDGLLAAYRNSRDQIIKHIEHRFGPRLTTSAERAAGASTNLADTRDELLDEIHRSLDALETYIHPIVSAHSMIGHNHPPDDQIIQEPLSRSDWLEIQDAIKEIRLASQLETVAMEGLIEPTETLNSKSIKLSRWIGARATKAVDATVVAVGTALGASIVIDPARLLDLTMRLLNSIQSFVSSAPLT